MKPDKEGIWEWFDADGTKRLVSVYDVARKLREVTGHAEPHLRVYWWGGYYNVNDDIDDLYDINGNIVEKGYVKESEWEDRWGNFVGEIGSVPEEQLYQMPTPEQRKKIFENLD